MKSLVKNLSNIPGWRTKRKLVVIESDDWGSIRMSSRAAYNRLLESNIFVDKDNYNSNDGLESNDDLEFLMSTLAEHKDSTGRNVVITGVNVVANPDFDKIKQNGFKEYEYEPYTKTCERYPKHDRVYELWLEAKSKRLIVPTFHGREHLNSQRWLRALQAGCESTKLAFENGVTGISKGINGIALGDYQAAFNIDSLKDIEYQKKVIETGLNLFEELYNERASFFVPTNGPFNNALESVVKEQGIKYLGTAKIQKEPLGDNNYKTHFRYLGKKGKSGLIYLTRNCFFEPNSWEYPKSKDWVNDCLKDIEIAFKWHKPAIISSHRVNYIGWLNANNRANGLKQLESLLTNILRKWPEVEFLTSSELGDLIASSTK